jgi:hypothetical protein
MTHALTVVLKPGYAPIEQYGDVASMTQGAWTDLYALACVVYYAITGKTPMSSVERLMDDRLEPIARVATGAYSAAFLGAIDAALAVRPQDRPQNVPRFRALLDADRLAAAPPAPAAPPVHHEAYASTELHSYSTVPGTLTPVLATQLLARAPSEAIPAAETETERAEASTFARMSGPAPMAMDSVLPAPAPATATPWAGAGTARRASQMPLIIVAVVIAALGLGSVGFWAVQRQGSGAAPSTGDAASESLRVPTPASAIALPPPTVPASAAIAAPAAPSTAAGLSSPPAAEPPPAATPSGETDLPTAPLHDAAPAAAPAPSLRPHREPAAPRATAPPEAKPDAPRRTTGGARCSDILQKASLEPLTSDEAEYLKRECR